MASASPVPQFITKLFKLANAPSTHTYICWGDDGSHFWVANIESFSRDVLPVYFKHNNYASFVRQLNMYGKEPFQLSCATSVDFFLQDSIEVLSPRAKLSLESL